MGKKGNKLPITKLKKLRTEFREKHNPKEWTQEAVARKVGASVKSYRDWENGERFPDTCYLVKLAQLFHVSCDYLLEISEYTHVGNAEIFKLTGLSDATTSRLIKANGDLKESLLLLPELNALLRSEEFWVILEELSIYRHHCLVEKNRPALIDEANKRANNAIAQYENAQHGENADEIEQYRATAENEIETAQRHKKDLDFSRKDKEIVWANLLKRFISLVNQIEQEVQNG